MPERRNYHRENGEILLFDGHCGADPNIPLRHKERTENLPAVNNIPFKQIARVLLEHLGNARYC